MRKEINSLIETTLHKRKANHRTLAWHLDTDKIANFDIVLSSAEAMIYIEGVGLQWEGKNVINELHKK
jgi:hypothetical protein